MSKYIDVELLVSLIRETVNVIEEAIDSDDNTEGMAQIRAMMEEGIACGEVDPACRHFTDAEILAGMGVIDMANRMVNNAYELLAKSGVVRTVSRKDNIVFIDERKLTDAEISANAEMGIADLEAFVANINRTKE